MDANPEVDLNNPEKTANSFHIKLGAYADDEVQDRLYAAANLKNLDLITFWLKVRVFLSNLRLSAG